MVGHIFSHFKSMHDLFLIMKTRNTLTDDEILMASGKKKLDDTVHMEYLKIVEAQAVNIKEAFVTQKTKMVVCFIFLSLYDLFYDILLTIRSRGIKKSLNGF